ncbi:hypothetical protein OGAPHI_004652 [Ogataea philodendri]|uniref:Uncharacterized protein n=1 Tax=Ogataea philodendri TaxID=1378263 RepID=A0A9P8P3A8_9ASCO|nr:uncharacterized protein OGAPHI_004652 [Ogataea philodendri]KAH3664300.1 hypothetical protein OGAPHI_004652 [Ogataea philodendri]
MDCSESSQPPSSGDDDTSNREPRVSSRAVSDHGKKGNKFASPSSPKLEHVNVENLLYERLNKLDSLGEITALEALAIFNRLIQNLLRLTSELESNDQLNLNDLLFKKDSSLSDQASTPILIQRKRARSLQNTNREDGGSTEGQNNDLDVPLRKHSRLDFNFSDNEIRPNIPHSEQGTSGAPSGSARSYSQDCIHFRLYRSDFQVEQSLSKKFYLLQAPSLPITTYLERIHHYSNLSTATLLTAAYYLFHMTFNLRPSLGSSLLPLLPPQDSDGTNHKVEMLPVGELNVFRLILTTLRIALKLIEDKNHKQAYFCKVTGIRGVEELFKLELTLLYLLDFNLFINEPGMIRFLFQFRQFDSNLRNNVK